MNEKKEPQRSPLDWFFQLFSDVKAGESPTVLLMLLTLMLALVSYYILKSAREGLILSTGGAELKSYASALQALVLMGLVPLYSWFSGRVDRNRLINVVVIVFFVCIELFFFGALLRIPYLAVGFFVFIGIFSLAIIAQFWAYANDVYLRSEGERLFPVIQIGGAAGAILGAAVAGWLLDAGLTVEWLIQVAGILLAVHFVLYLVIRRRPEPLRSEGGGAEEKPKLQGKDGFALLMRSPYLRLIALLLLVLNLVNTTGEYILGKQVGQLAGEAFVNHAQTVEFIRDVIRGSLEDPATDFKDDFIGGYIGGFYADFFLWVNVATSVLQAFIVSRLVKYTGIAGVLLALPIVALTAYSLAAAGVAFTVFRWAKTAENATDYSIMNTARALLWLPTSRDEKYNAKQAADTFVVRLGDLLSAGLVFVGSEILHAGVQSFALVNVGLVVAIWLGTAFLLLRQYYRLAKERESVAPAAA